MFSVLRLPSSSHSNPWTAYFSLYSCPVAKTRNAMEEVGFEPTNP